MFQHHTDLKQTSDLAEIFSFNKKPFPLLISNDSQFRFQNYDSFSDTTDLGPRQAPEIDSQETEPSASESTLRPVGERIKRAVDEILSLLEDLYALVLGRTELESVGNSEASGLRRDQLSTSSPRNRHDKVTGDR